MTGRLPLRAAAIAVALTIVVSGCGSKTGTGTPAAPEHAIPAGSLVYADANLDRGSDAWHQLEAVGQRFPGWGGMVDKLVHDVGSGSHGSTFERDVEPWLGNSAAFAVTSVDSSSSNLSAASGHYVLAVASTDDGAAKDALAREGTADGSYGGYTQFTTSDHSEAAVGEGMVLVANDADTLHLAIDTRAGKGDDITSDDGFSAALAGLPADSLVRGWVNTQKLAEMASLATLGGNGAAQMRQLADSLKSIESVTFAAWASSGGLHLTVHTKLAPGAPANPFTAPGASSLTPLVPANAFAFLAVPGFGTYLKQSLEARSMTGPQLQLFEQQTGISFQHDLVPLLSGDLLFYAGPGVPVSASLVLKPDDPDRAEATMRKLTALFAMDDPSVRVVPLPSGDGQALSGGGLPLEWRRTPDGLITIGDDPAAGTAPAQPLSSSAAYRDLLTQAGAPADAAVVLYANVAGTLAHLPVHVDENVRHVGGILVWGTHDGSESDTNLFVQIS